MLSKILLTFILIFNGVLYGQVQTSDTRNIYISNDTCLIKASIEKGSPKVSIKNDIYYSWYAYNEIHSTQGGFDGKLLTGTYKEFYVNNSLKRQGGYKKGNKIGVWKAWFPDGRISQISHWKNGLKHGELLNYYSSGKLESRYCYKQDLLHGIAMHYKNNGEVSKSKYKKGNLIRTSNKGKSKRKKSEPQVSPSSISDSTSMNKQPDLVVPTQNTSTEQKKSKENSEELNKSKKESEPKKKSQDNTEPKKNRKKQSSNKQNDDNSEPGAIKSFFQKIGNFFKGKEKNKK